MRIGFIGAGKVGCTLGKYLSEYGLALSGYYSRSAASAAEAAEFTCSRAFGGISELVCASDVIFITVPDGSIRAVYESMADIDISGRMICHCSGALSSAEAFPDIEDRGAEGYSIHPLFPVSSKFKSFEGMKNAFFCIEGDSRHIGMWKSIFEEAGNPVKVIGANVKVRYHAACSVASNLVCALLYESFSLLGSCGFSVDEAAEAIGPLVMSNIERIFEAGVVEALTGPVERNDVETVRKHLDCLGGTDVGMYKAVSAKLVEIAEEKHPGTDYSELRELLRGNA